MIGIDIYIARSFRFGKNIQVIWTVQRKPVKDMTEEREKVKLLARLKRISGNEHDVRIISSCISTLWISIKNYYCDNTLYLMSFKSNCSVYVALCGKFDQIVSRPPSQKPICHSCEVSLIPNTFRDIDRNNVTCVFDN